MATVKELKKWLDRFPDETIVEVGMQEALSMVDFVESMKDVYTTSVVSETLDEAPQAYKSIDEIKSAITDTVDIVGVIKPLYNFKSH